MPPFVTPHPFVSIGLPVHNGGRYLSDAIDSILAQSYRDFELLISDNASTDNTASICRDYASRDGRVRFVRQDRNLGAAANFNYVFHHTMGRYFRWAAYDDMIAACYLERTVAALEADTTGAVLAYTQTLRINSDGRELGIDDRVTRKGGDTAAERLAKMIGPGDHTASLIHMCFPVFGLVRREVLEKTSLIANMPRSDKLLLVELALHGPFLELSEPLFLRREHDEGSVIAAEAASSAGELERQLASWFDPQRGKWFPATNSRLGAGYFRAALGTPMPLSERLAALRVIAGWCRRNVRIIGGEMKTIILERLTLSKQ